jgi:hypothetical protein
MKTPACSFSSEIVNLQKNCRLTLDIDGDKIALSFDDVIEFKIEITEVLASGIDSAREIHGSFDQWRIKFFPNKGGFSIEIRHPIRPINTLALDAEQTAEFLQELQYFIDDAGRRN